MHDSRGSLAPRGRMRREPAVREQLVELSFGEGWHLAQDVLPICERVDPVVLAGAGHGVEDRRRTATAVTPEERPVAASDRLGTEHPLGEVVVDAQLPVLG